MMAAEIDWSDIRCGVQDLHDVACDRRFFAVIVLIPMLDPSECVGKLFLRLV